MWIFSTIGFFSLTQSRNVRGMMHFRARERVDLVNLCKRFDIAPDIIITPQADYRFRLVIPPIQAAQIVMGLAQDIDYANFKDAVHRNPTQHRKGPAYMRVWSVMNELQPRHNPGRHTALDHAREFEFDGAHGGHGLHPDGFGGEDFPTTSRATVLDNPRERRPAPASRQKLAAKLEDETHATCPQCLRRVKIGVPAGGDGSIDVFYRHKGRNGKPCMASRGEVENEHREARAVPLLTPAQVRALRAVKDHGDVAQAFRGRSEHGGGLQTIGAVEKLGLVRYGREKDQKDHLTQLGAKVLEAMKA